MAGHPAGPLPGRDRFTSPHQPWGEVFPHQCDDAIVVDVARNRDDHALGRVPPHVERMQLRTRHGRDRLDTADHRAPNRMPGEHRRQEHVAQGVLRVVVTHGDFFQDDVAFDLDVGYGATAPQHHVGHQIDGQLQVGVEHVRVVARVLASGERVQFAADRVDRLRDLHGRTGRRRLEQQMLEEVCGASHAMTFIA